MGVVPFLHFYRYTYAGIHQNYRRRNCMTESRQMIDEHELQAVVDEAALIREARNDPQAFARLYRVYVQPVYRYLLSRIGSTAEAEDACAQTFLAALESLPRYREDGHFAAWLFTIARRKAADHFRAQRHLVAIEEIEEYADPADLVQDMLHLEQRAGLRTLITALADRERELIRLRYQAGLTFQDIARLTKRSEGAVKKELYRLLARLQSQMEAHDEQG